MACKDGLGPVMLCFPDNRALILSARDEWMSRCWRPGKTGDLPSMSPADWRKRKRCTSIEETNVLSKTTCQSFSRRRPGQRSYPRRVRNTLAYLTIRCPQQQGIICSTRHRPSIWRPAYRSYCLLVAGKKQGLCQHPVRLMLRQGAFRHHRWNTTPRRKRGRHAAQESSSRTTDEDTSHQKGSPIHRLMRERQRVCGTNCLTDNWPGRHCRPHAMRNRARLSFQDKTSFREQVCVSEAYRVGEGSATR